MPDTCEEMELVRRSRRADLVGPTEGGRDRERERCVGDGDWKTAEGSGWGSKRREELSAGRVELKWA